MGKCPNCSSVIEDDVIKAQAAKVSIKEEVISNKYDPERADAIITYLALVLDRCVDRNCRLSIWHTARASVERASTQHALNLTSTSI